MTPTPFEISHYDNPESVRARKYATGTHLVLEGAGVHTGKTPKKTVWTSGPVRLYRYEPEKPRRYPVPILIVYAHILKPYILDLVPENSFVEHLLGQGHDVYLLDWGTPGPEDVDMSFENYVLDYLPEAVDRALEYSSVEEYTLLGHCMGGTIAAMYASLFPERLRNLVLLASPIDFAPEEPGLMGLWTYASRNSEAFFDPDLLVRTFGNIPEDLLERQMSRRPLRATWCREHPRLRPPSPGRVPEPLRGRSGHISPVRITSHGRDVDGGGLT